MQNEESKKNQEMNHVDLSSSEENSAEPAVIQSAPAERMSLSLLRRRVRAGWYEDDLYAQEARRLLFLRWLVREGLLSEWETEGGG